MNGYPEGFETWPEIMTAKNLAAVFDMSERSASQMMNQAGFPLLIPGARRNRQVNKYRLIQFLREGR